MSVNLNAIGSYSEPVTHTWTDTECMLYSLSIGLSYPDFTKDLQYTTENTEGVELQVIPTFASIIGRDQEAEWLAFGPAPGQTFLASEEIVLMDVIPTSGQVRVHTRVENVYDKGSGALLEMFSTARDVKSDRDLFTRRWTVFIRDEGGFGGERGPSVPKLPAFSPEHTIECDVNPLSALLYRLLDGRSQIHSDPALAHARGFKRPIMHGRGTLGYACQLIIKHLQGAPDRRLGGICGYFQRPLLPGDRIRLEASWQSKDVLIFQVLNQEGETVLSAGRCEFVESSR